MDEEMEIYGGFAEVYDLFMDNIPYDTWYEYLHGLLLEQGIDQGIIVDLACGTGTITAMLAEDGYDMIGVDQSEEMLEFAREKCSETVLLLQQDIRKLDLYGSATAMICVCDGMNYLLEEGDLREVFRRVYTFLDYGGVFLFDLKTAHFYETVLGDRTIAENREDASLIWENEYDSDTGIHEYLITTYRLVDEEEDLFERAEELHRQRAYAQETIQGLLAEAGLTCKAVYNAFTKEEPQKESERLYFIAVREK